MNKRKIKIRQFYLTILLTAILAHGSSIYAADNPPDETYEYLDGMACSGFDLRIESWAGHTQSREFAGKGVIQFISAGQGSQLRFTNLSNEKILETKANGATNQYYKYNNDGTQLLRMTGHNILILFPTDSPQGPSTTLHIGEVEVLIDYNNNFFVQSEHGKKTDICAALSD